MNKIHKRRIYFISLLLLGLGITSGLILYALKQNINVFLTPHELTKAHLPQDHHFRLGGMVKNNSIKHEENSLGVNFTVTDLKSDIKVHYVGVLPDLFREGKGVVTEGHLDKYGVFIANQVLAKHDENYMPANVKKAIQS